MSSIEIACTNRTASSAMTHPSTAHSKKHRQTIATKAIPQETPSSKRYEPITVSSEAAKRYEKGMKSWKPSCMRIRRLGRKNTWGAWRKNRRRLERGAFERDALWRRGSRALWRCGGRRIKRDRRPHILELDRCVLAASKRPLPIACESSRHACAPISLLQGSTHRPSTQRRADARLLYGRHQELGEPAG